VAEREIAQKLLKSILPDVEFCGKGSLKLNKRVADQDVRFRFLLVGWRGERFRWRGGKLPAQFFHE
jgi:hypothetical protein